MDYAPNVHVQDIGEHALVQSRPGHVLALVCQTASVVVLPLCTLHVIHLHFDAPVSSIVISFAVPVLQHRNSPWSRLLQDAPGAFRVLHAHEE